MFSFTFPVGYVKMHKVKIIDFQLNRWYSFGYARLDDMQQAAKRIRGLSDWKDEMVRQAEKALTENIPLKMHYMQISALKNAISVTGRIFTKEEHGQNHCQDGNIGLALNVMSDWIKEKENSV